MSLRGIWIFASSASNKGKEKVVFSRYFSTVERRSALIQKQNVKIPGESVICESLMQKMGATRTSTISSEEEYHSENESCSKPQWKPVYEVILKDSNSLWPVVAIEKGKPPLIELPGVTIGYKLLHSIIDFIGPWTSREELSSKIKDLQMYLCVAVPFGTPVDTNPLTVQALITGKDLVTPQRRKQPAWKPVGYKGKQQLLFAIKEEIKAVQHQADSSQDVYQLFGTIICKADIEGIPEIMVTIISPCLEYLIVHPSVQEGDAYIHDTSMTPNQRSIAPGSVGRRLRFRPPAETFPLCHYSGQARNGLPIEGIYQMKGDEKAVQISLQLKLNSKVKNSLDYCEVHFPFFNRGYITKVESAGPSHGNIVSTSGKRKLVWSIGQKFPKSLEVVFAATVLFGDCEQTRNTQQSGFVEDPFCQGLNSYVQIFFKMTEFTLTGCTIDPRSLNIIPTSKLSKVHTSTEFTTTDYKIWNTFGDAMASTNPPKIHDT